MSPYMLERLYFRLGQPAWFWPSVLSLLFVLTIVGSSCSPEWELAA